MSAVTQQRYKAFLSGFDYSIEYRTSKANSNADSLSRLPLKDQWGTEEDANDLFYKEVHMYWTQLLSVQSLSQENHDMTLFYLKLLIS